MIALRPSLLRRDLIGEQRLVLSQHVSVLAMLVLALLARSDLLFLAFDFHDDLV